MSALAPATKASSRQWPSGPYCFASSRRLTWAQLRAAPVRTPRASRLREPPSLGPPKLDARLEKLGIRSLGDLFEHLPRARRELCSLRALRVGEQATVAVTVRSIRVHAARRRGLRSLVEATVYDDSASLRAAFFNQPWLERRYRPGTRLLLHGKLDARRTLRVWSHALDADPAAVVRTAGCEPASTPPGAAIPHYPVTDGLSSTQLASLMRASRHALTDVVEPLPASLRANERLPERAAALTAMHFAANAEEHELGRRRLAFDELLLGQLMLLRRRARRATQRGALALSHCGSLSTRWLAGGVPFTLTEDQRAAMRAIDADLAREYPMKRLLVGEVGSGKTVVALYAMLRAVEHAHQAALMAPTETLAEQHFETLGQLLHGEPVSLALLTSSTGAGARRRLCSRLIEGRLSIVVGTHALIEPEVEFRALAVAVVDEQHRFGVAQRAELGDRSAAVGRAGHARAPHMLHMTATPIPRTLALASYGDLDVSTLRKLPRGRREVHTRIVVGAAARARAYGALRAQLEAGRQAYVVCPLVSEQGAEELAAGITAEGGGLQQLAVQPGAARDAAGAGRGQLRAAKAELQRLAGGELAGFRAVLLHGQMPTSEKRRAMAAFVSGEAQVLVSTTVVEVGIDVPNATVMIIENAERFGISQLHQLRGRVGRSEHRAECSLMSSVGVSNAPRLRALAASSDGFELAEIDLRLRGRGELIGTRQSGPDCFRVARLPEDGALLENARRHGELIIASDPELRAPEHALLQDRLEERFGGESLAPIRA
jgi:ATP-dependent DNA helicase RecG